MFDIGFFELLLIAVVGLVVIGPERLPSAIRTAALWWGRMKRSIRETRTELERQLGADEIRRELHNEEVMRSLEALRKTSRELEHEVQAAQASVIEEQHSATAVDHGTANRDAQPEVTPQKAPSMPEQPDADQENNRS